ncbi:hypothetical protein LIER_09319 [Lithospermum erythrorhizon]|uniref:Aminotransferase-like plant mobile domain-containing protein n=1 Tax=Lithospermum erythrorhizon TaxID=34254 RepID=A0AAV3PHG7_LITER
MDEVVPSAECLSSSLGKKECIPESCCFLLHAYHSLASSSFDSSVSPTELISFWSSLPLGYTWSLTTESDIAGSWSLPCFPRGYVPAHGSCSAESLQVFKRLGVPSSLADEVYCAAFLSCWLCTFVLPLDVTGSIRPSVFKMASYMVDGKIVSFSILVLASIYKGLHLITTARYPNNSACCFPVHYLLGWMGAYLRTYTSLKRYPPGPYMLGFSPAIPGFKSRFRDTVLDFGGLSYQGCQSNPGTCLPSFEFFCIEVADSEEPSDCMITEVADIETSGDEDQTEVVDAEEPSDGMITEGEELKDVFSKARHVKDAWCSVVPPEYEERTARLRQELTELDIHVEDLRRQVIVRESVIIALEADQAEFVLKTPSLEESIEKGRES